MAKPILTHDPVWHRGVCRCRKCKAILTAGSAVDIECPGHLVRIPHTNNRRPPLKPGRKPFNLPDRSTPLLPGLSQVL